MRWSKMVTHDDAYGSLVWAQHRREVRRLRERRRRRLRLVLTVPGLVGLALLLWACFTMDPPSVQVLKIAVGMVLLVPWMATWTEPPRRRSW